MVGKKPYNAACTGSTMNRKTSIKLLQSTTFDLLVVGGGITGAGIALDAASRGLTVALVEGRDFGSGTSSRSTKLIHGGLRYLKQFEFKLVNEVGRERAIVHRLAPHLVHPDKMLLPLIRNGNYGYWLTNVGLTVYDFLAGVEGNDRRKMLSREDTLLAEPLLRRRDLEGGGLYAEYRTDDARLVMAVIKTAASLGATAANYLKVNRLLDVQGKAKGAVVYDAESGNEFTINAKAVVNAAGPWVDDLRKMAGEPMKKHLRLTKGVHLVVSRQRLPIQQTVYFDNSDKRMIFAVPRGATTYLGTTDTEYSGDLYEPLATQSDVHYILNAVNEMFPDCRLTLDDVESSWTGLRPLIHEEGKSASEVSRRDELFQAPNGLISIAGGKLTGYRKMAERVVDRVLTTLGMKHIACSTASIQLTDAHFADYAEVQNLIEQLNHHHSNVFIARTDARYLVENYGNSSVTIVQKALTSGGDLKALLAAEVAHAVNEEMCCTAIDFWERRTGRLNFDIATVAHFSNEVIDWLASRLGWSYERRSVEAKSVQSAIARASGLNGWRK